MDKINFILGLLLLHTKTMAMQRKVQCPPCLEYKPKDISFVIVFLQLQLKQRIQVRR